ncbi:MAG: hypothetical protein ABIK28_05790 [Planctomycetota bacterium]
MYDPDGELKCFNTKKEIDELMEKYTPSERLRRPVFTKGEAVLLKGAPFRIVSLGRNMMTLRPLPWGCPKHEELKGK